MNMWNHLSPKSLIDLQRKAALEQMGGREARDLLAYGDGPGADRILDEMAERQRSWEGA